MIRGLQRDLSDRAGRLPWASGSVSESLAVRVCWRTPCLRWLSRARANSFVVRGRVTGIAQRFLACAAFARSIFRAQIGFSSLGRRIGEPTSARYCSRRLLLALALKSQAKDSMSSLHSVRMIHRSLPSDGVARRVNACAC